MSVHPVFISDNSALENQAPPQGEISLPSVENIALPVLKTVPLRDMKSEIRVAVAFTRDAREEREKKEEMYYETVQRNKQELGQWLEFGKYTRNTSEIRVLTENLYKGEAVVFPDGSIKDVEKTDDPIRDYIVKSLIFVAGSIHSPPLENGKYKQLSVGQIPADKVLARGWGWCDEKSILFASLMRVQGIPAKIVVRKYARDDYFYGALEVHSENLVWWNNTWVKVDPSFAKFGSWTANGEDVTMEDNIFMSNVEKW
jgi:hypothetical protein